MERRWGCRSADESERKDRKRWTNAEDREDEGKLSLKEGDDKMRLGGARWAGNLIIMNVT